MEQKDLFGASSDRLPYVECSPAGRGGPISAKCREMNIKSFPTWIIDGHRYEGVLKPDRLADLSGYTGHR
ncbi:MAG: hypothetical protein HZA16_03110 [Nitrospirae bacterium]|nr:hypothetical protein [Nitrospirota bacterium]